MMTAREAAEHLGVSVSSIYALAAPAGPILCYRIGRAVRFSLADIEEYKLTCRIAPHERGRVKGARTVIPASLDIVECFRKAGIEIRPEHMVRKRRPE